MIIRTVKYIVDLKIVFSKLSLAKHYFLHKKPCFTVTSIYAFSELGEVQILLHKIVHVDWLRFCALRNKMGNERKVCKPKYGSVRSRAPNSCCIPSVARRIARAPLENGELRKVVATLVILKLLLVFIKKKKKNSR